MAPVTGTATLRRGLRRARRAGQRMLAAPFAWLGRALLGTVTGVATDRPMVALTFDDGPHPAYTPALLDVLAHHGARATFFVIGRQVRAHPELAARIAREGHTLANHTDSHPLLPALAGRARRAEIAACAATIAPYGGARLLRPPQGRQSLASRLDALRMGHAVVTWSGHAEDWRPHDARWMAAKLAGELRPGAIILLHDAIEGPTDPAVVDRTATIAAVELLLAEAAGRYSFVTLPELLRAGRPERLNWYRPIQVHQ